MIQYKARVREGLLLELPAEAGQLHLRPGDMVQVSLEPEIAPSPVPLPNQKAQDALNTIARRQQGRPHTDGTQTQRLLREAREGAMYSDAASEQST